MVTSENDIEHLDYNQSTQGNMPGGRLTIEESVVAKIAGLALREVSGVSLVTDHRLMQTVTSALKGDNNDQARGIKLTVTPDHASFELRLVVDYPESIPELVEAVRRKISERVRTMTGLEVTDIHIHVVDINQRGSKQTTSDDIQKSSP